MSDTTDSVALRYHTRTNHSVQSVGENLYRMDSDNRPLPYKIYSSLEPLVLPHSFVPSTMSALDAIASSIIPSKEELMPDRELLARLCFFANGVTKRFHLQSGQEHALRAAACTGALFHIELYIVCGDVPGLAAGIYHFGAHDTSFRQLRAGDFRQVLIEATGNEQAIVEAPAIIICTSTFWRNAYKYQARAYRHTFWDTGTILANFLSESASIEIPAKIILGFVDKQVNALLDVNAQKEAAVSLIAVGHTSKRPTEAPPVTPLHLPTVRISTREQLFPLIHTIHTASSLTLGSEVAAWRSLPEQRILETPAQPLLPLIPLASTQLPEDSIEAVIKRRGSTRHFTGDAISFEQLSTMLTRSMHSILADCMEPVERPINDLYLIANAVNGLEAGTYVLHREQQALELLKKGDMRETAFHLALDQNLGSDAAVNIYFLADLEPVLARFGDRGYRVAQLEASILAGKLYLAAYALGLGATGLTFFDDEVTAFFSPHSAGKSVMFLIALGKPLKKSKQ